jgi:outer membrane biogenesis lipoprotein LolB
MIRRKLLIATAIIASVVLTACSDMTGPKSTACPILNGSSICMTH